MGLYYYAKAGVMVGHEFSDDAAIVKAISKRKAWAKLEQTYKGISTKEVHRIKKKWLKEVFVLTSY